MVIHVTCQEITGYSRAELTELCERARIRAGEPMTEDQKQAARVLLEACAAFIDARLAVPKDIRLVIAELITQGEDFGWVATASEETPAAANSDEASTMPKVRHPSGASR
jgi:hypothetical protein